LKIHDFEAEFLSKSLIWYVYRLPEPQLPGIETPGSIISWGLKLLETFWCVIFCVAT